MNENAARPLLVITRPLARAARLAGWARQRDLPCLLLPLIDIVAVDDVGGILKDAARYDVLFWVSPSAVEVGAPHIARENFDGKLAAPGRATAEALRAATGREVFYPPAGNDSEAVLRLPLWSEVRGRVLTVGGVGGRDFLARRLRERGFAVDVAEIYRRLPRLPEAEDVERIATHPGAVFAVIFSREAAEIWAENLLPALRRARAKLLYFTVHPRIGDVLRAKGAGDVIDCSSEQALIALLCKEYP